MIALGLCLQAAALLILFYRLRREWFTHVGAWFVLLAVAYHGLNEVFLWWFPGYDPYRLLVTPDYVGQFVIWVSVAILLFSVAYVVTVGRRSISTSGAETTIQLRRTTRFFDWRVMSIAALPLLVLTLGGQGYLSNIDVSTQSPGVAVGLSNQFFLLAVVLASFGLVSRFGTRALLPVLAAQSLLVASTGERLGILVTAAMLLYALARFGVRMNRRQLIVGVVLSAMLTLVITSARATEEPFLSTADSSIRIQYLVAGLRNIGSPAALELLANNVGYRLDGNSFGAMELEALARGASTLGLAPLQNDVALAVPSFLNPNKDNSDITTRVEKDYAAAHLGLLGLEVAPGTWLDILPTQLGDLMGFWGPWGMLVASLVLGALFGLADRWLAGGVGPSRILVGLGLMYCALFYETSWDIYTVTFRGVILLLLVVFALKLASSSVAKGFYGIVHSPRAQQTGRPSPEAEPTSFGGVTLPGL